MVHKVWETFAEVKTNSAATKPHFYLYLVIIFFLNGKVEMKKDEDKVPVHKIEKRGLMLGGQP